MTCACAGKGLVKVNYHDGTPFDLGICRCVDGQRFRSRGPRFLELLVGLSRVPPERIHVIEDLADEEDMIAIGIVATKTRHANGEDFTQAGKVGKKARL